MKIGDILYFAPGVRFSDLDLEGHGLPSQFNARIEGLFLGPAERCAANGDSFAAGLLCVVAIDAMSRLHFGPNRVARHVQKDFCVFAQQLLPSFRAPGAARILYVNYRNGLVHEARLKNGCQFVLDRPSDITGPAPTLNPVDLLEEVRSALAYMVGEMGASSSYRREFTRLLKREFAFELEDFTVGAP